MSAARAALPGISFSSFQQVFTLKKGLTSHHLGLLSQKTLKKVGLFWVQQSFDWENHLMRKITHLPRNLLRLSGGMILFLSALAGAQDDPGVNRLLASQCAQCHGYNGHAVGDIDGLAGESVRELRDEMREMADGTPDEIMEHQALGYT
ncbi:MAG: hypothetical protein NWR12_03465, partial [Haliea sp.]|nr:hypothetical protein [Haliea sp.]